MNYGPDALPLFTIGALSVDGSVLQSYVMSIAAPISTPGLINGGAFRGIVCNRPDIAACRLTAEAFAIDDLTFSSAPEPLPCPLVLTVLTLTLIVKALARDHPMLRLQKRQTTKRTQSVNRCRQFQAVG